MAFSYTAAGYRVQEKDASSSYVLRQVSARDSRNRVIQASLANSAMTHTADYFDATGPRRELSAHGQTQGRNGRQEDALTDVSIGRGSILLRRFRSKRGQFSTDVDNGT